MSTRSMTLLTTLVLCLLSAGCICSIGGGEKCPPAQQCTTAGQELIDLKKAHDQGAITDEEYDQKKQCILSNK